MNLLHDDDRPSRAMALHGARKQAQAGAERSLAESARHNAALRLLTVDDRLRKLVDDYCALTDAARGELARAADQLMASHPRPVEKLARDISPAAARAVALVKSALAAPALSP